MAASKVRRVAISDDDEQGYASPGFEIAPEDMSRWDDPADEGDRREEWAISQEVNELLARGWSVASVAGYLGIAEAQVRDAGAQPDDDDEGGFIQTPEEVYGLEPDGEW